MKTNILNTNAYTIKQLPNAIAFVDRNLKLNCASDEWAAFFNLDYHMAIGKQLFDVIDESNYSWREPLVSTLEGNTECFLQTTLTGNGIEKWFELSTKPWYNEEENIIGAIIQVEDVSNRVLMDLKFQKLENLLRDQSEISKVGTWEYDLDSERIEWSAMTKKIHEVPHDFQPSIDKAINFYKQGHDRNTISMLVHNCIEKGETWNTKLKIVTAKANERWVLAAGKPFYKDGKISRLIGTFQDITEDVEAENKIIENEKLLRTLIDNIPLNIFIKDKDSKKVLVNKAECDYLGVSNPQEIIGKTDYDLYDKDVADISRHEDVHVMKTQKPILKKRTINVKKDGSSTSFLTSKIPFVNADGRSKGVIGISMDISDVIQKEDQLRNLINVTAIQNKKLINFAHIVSHNLRSHTANFSMLLDFLVNEKEASERKRIMDMLLHASDNLMDTLENLNEVVDISTDVNLEKKSLNLNENITKVQQNLSAFLHQNNVQINNNIADTVNVKAVPAYMESIILNLVTNAVKYRHPDRNPSIVLSAKKKEDITIFCIQDNGLGIDLDKYGQKLFGMYKTFHNNKDARGIGLYIVKNQIEAMGGNITVKSEVEKGSTFSVYFNDKD